METIKEIIYTFLNWWKEGIAYLIPVKVRQFLLGLHDPVFIKIAPPIAEAGIVGDDGQFSVKESLNFNTDGGVNKSDTIWINKMIHKHHPLIIQVPESMGLTTQIVLPIKAKKDLSRIVPFEIERKTPFSSDKILYAYRILDLDKKSGRMKVGIDIVPNDYANNIFEWLDDRDLSPDILTLESGYTESTSGIDGINLLPPARATRKLSTSNQFYTVLTLCAFVLLIVVFNLPVFYKQIEISKLQDKYDSMYNNVKQVEDLRKEYDRLLSENEFLQAKKRQSHSVIAVIDKVTRLFPDNTHLSRLELIGKQLNLHGESDSASSLIRILEDDDMFYNVEFKAPVTRNEASGSSRFHIAAELSNPVS